jgi:hypothetical protein
MNKDLGVGAHATRFVGLAAVGARLASVLCGFYVSHIACMLADSGSVLLFTISPADAGRVYATRKDRDSTSARQLWLHALGLSLTSANMLETLLADSSA